MSDDEVDLLAILHGEVCEHGDGPSLCARCGGADRVSPVPAGAGGVDRRPCPFCARIVAEHFDARDGDVVRFEPLNPVTPGHMLFVPARHVASAADGPHYAGEAMRAAAAFGMVQAEDFNLITSSGGAATQTVRHLHVHYVPRRAGDGLSLPWTGSGCAGCCGATRRHPGSHDREGARYRRACSTAPGRRRRGRERRRRAGDVAGLRTTPRCSVVASGAVRERAAMSGKRAILVSRDRQGDWCDWRPVRVVAEHGNTWRIWSWREPFTRLVHKHAMGERVTPR